MTVRMQDLSLETLVGRNPAFGDAIRFLDGGGDAGLQQGQFEGLLDRLQIFAPSRDGAPYLHCGRESTTGELYGRDFVNGLVGQPGLAHEAFERAVRTAYQSVHLTGRPVGQRVSAILDVHGRSRLVSYYRLVFPITLGSNRVTGCLTRFC
ncbi:hypothetical protein KAJ83_04240 [Marivibrio halodurans]|uniref:Uncharacterized protein n=1 Tax=Marivibrio halodurans TaxID=2039722 RepID=A0A8J7SLF9_9PROT|nr:hypothetical protein [Marivibrio halodurans]MBP5856206.1 hypothetical protein [Marivibrio halodurans]